MKSELEKLVGRYRELGLDRQLDYDKFYLYSIITHSTAIEGSTITELENQIMFDNGIALKGKSPVEQNMNLDLKAAYERALVFAREHADVTVERLKELSTLTMKNTGSEYHTALGDILSRIFSDDKEEYIKALVATRESEDLGIFRRFMTDTMIAHLNRDISSYMESIGEDALVEQPKKKGKTRDKIIELLRKNPKHTTRTLAEEIGITPKGVTSPSSKPKVSSTASTPTKAVNGTL